MLYGTLRIYIDEYQSLWFNWECNKNSRPRTLQKNFKKINFGPINFIKLKLDYKNFGHINWCTLKFGHKILVNAIKSKKFSEDKILDR